MQQHDSWVGDLVRACGSLPYPVRVRADTISERTIDSICQDIYTSAERMLKEPVNTSVKITLRQGRPILSKMKYREPTTSIGVDKIPLGRPYSSH